MSFYIVIRGPLGCGKSTISERLSKILNVKYFAVDRVLEEHDLENDWETGYISQKSFKKANEIIFPQAKKILDSGRSVVFDGNFYLKFQIEDLIKRLDFPNYVFTLKAPLTVCIGRNRKRNKTHGEDAVRAVYKKSTEFEYGIVININKPLKECIDNILSHLPKP